MERKIGEIFEYNGEWYQCVENDSCGECSLFTTECRSGTKSNLADKVFWQCSKVRRIDNKHIVFKKLKKVGEPYTNYYPSGRVIRFQRYKLFNKLYFHNTGYIMCDFIEDDIVSIEIKQNKENMEEKKQKLDKLVDDYMACRIQYAEFDKELKALYDKEENKPLLKEFDLEAAKAGKPVCTRDGRKARVICFDRDAASYNIVALTEYKNFPNKEEEIKVYNNNGKYISGEENDLDLMMLPEKKEGWVNIYRGQVYNAFEKAEEARKIAEHGGDNYLKTIKIEWEE